MKFIKANPLSTRLVMKGTLFTAGLALLLSLRWLQADDGSPAYSLGVIAPIPVVGDGHVSSTKNGVKFDVHFCKGPKDAAVIYAINTGRKQLVLTPDKHKAILEDLIKRKFTVIVADFRDKKLKGLELEHYVTQLTADAREVADGRVHASGTFRSAWIAKEGTTSRTDTHANDYFTVMPGFTVERNVTWFRYADIPEPFRKEMARQLGKPFSETDGNKANTYDIIHPVYGPPVGALMHYGSDEKARQDYYPTDLNYLVMAFALKNLAIVHQQYFNDPVGGYHQGYDYYGDQFAACFVRHLKGNADKYHLDSQKLCGFGHSKGSEISGMLVNKLRGDPEFLYLKANYKKMALSDKDRTIPSPYSHLPTAIACAIMGAGIANQEMASNKMLPWDKTPAKNISPFFLYADHREDTRRNTKTAIAKARENGVDAETAELRSHDWPNGEAYDRASAFADRVLRLEY